MNGQESVKRGIEVAAAGGHNLLMVGRPVLVKRCWQNVFPPSSGVHEGRGDRNIQIHSVAGLLGKDQPLVTRRLLRAPITFQMLVYWVEHRIQALEKYPGS